MPTIAYLANTFPSPTERYVVDEIQELRQHGIHVVASSVRPPAAGIDRDLEYWTAETLYLQPLQFVLCLQAAWLCVREFAQLKKYVRRVLLQGRESPAKRMRALAHTFLGAYYAMALRKFGVTHIHVHHGYFGSWIAVVAARLLGIEFSMTLHGSDMLLHPAYLDLKLELCQLCVTISEFNRRHLLAHYPYADPRKIVVQRLGVDCAENHPSTFQSKRDHSSLIMLAAGRLHPVKDHAFLLRACRELKARGLKFVCLIVGEGPERRRLERMIREFALDSEVRLLGRVPHEQMGEYYEVADLVVLTSRSEGIPLVLMEAMACEKIVLAPDITAISELVSHAQTGFLYRPGSLTDFAAQVETIRDNQCDFGALRRTARLHVKEHFNRQTNLAAFCDRMIAALSVVPAAENSELPQGIVYENPVLQ